MYIYIRYVRVRTGAKDLYRGWNKTNTLYNDRSSVGKMLDAEESEEVKRGEYPLYIHRELQSLRVHSDVISCIPSHKLWPRNAQS